MKRFLALAPDLFPLFVSMALIVLVGGLLKLVPRVSAEVGIEVAVDCAVVVLAGLYVVFLALRQTLVDLGLWRVLGR